MKIAVDRNIPYAEEAFSTLGEVTLFDQDEINNQVLIPYDVLIIRSVCRVDSQLLRNTKVRFVGSTTIGHDHLDQNYLHTNKIAFANAPGCNATAVGEFTINALIQLLKKHDLTIQNLSLGIIGAGHTGSALRQKADAIGINTYLCDPFLPNTDKIKYLSFEQIIKRANILSFHVPLTKRGSHPTYHLINNTCFDDIIPGTILINTSRGEVLEQEAVIRYRDKLGGLILDVWENEPFISPEILEITDIATPHIAGYSAEGKLQATNIIYRQLANFFQQKPTWNSFEQGEIQNKTISLSNENSSLEDILKYTYDIFEDDRDMRKIISSQSKPQLFKELRNSYSYRNEFSTYSLSCSTKLDGELEQKLKALGFNLN
jgi:erythronate-4-phosphate dehydrogenase